MEKLKKSGLYFIFPLISFWLPFLCVMLDQYGWVAIDDLFLKGFWINSVLLYNPVTIAIVSVVFGLKRGFDWRFPLLLILLFSINVVVSYFLNSAGMEIYLPIYGLISLLFLGMGDGLKLLKRLLNRSSQFETI